NRLGWIYQTYFSAEERSGLDLQPEPRSYWHQLEVYIGLMAVSFVGVSEAEEGERPSPSPHVGTRGILLSARSATLDPRRGPAGIGPRQYLRQHDRGPFSRRTT